MIRETRRCLATLHRKRAEIDREIADVLEAEAGGATETVYRSDGPLPLGVSRETFNRKAPGIPGARKVGGRGRGYWEVPCEAWFEALRCPAPALRLVADAAETDRDKARSFLRDAGFRATTKAAKR